MRAFSRRHYEAVAYVLRVIELEERGDAETLSLVRERLADLFAGDNARFQRERFERAARGSSS